MKYKVEHYNPNYSDDGEVEIEAKNEEDAREKFYNLRPYEIFIKATRVE